MKDPIENCRKLSKLVENCRNLSKLVEDHQKLSKANEIDPNPSTSIENPRIIHKNVRIHSYKLFIPRLDSLDRAYCAYLGSLSHRQCPCQASRLVIHCKKKPRATENVTPKWHMRKHDIALIAWLPPKQTNYTAPSKPRRVSQARQLCLFLYTFYLNWIGY